MTPSHVSADRSGGISGDSGDLSPLSFGKCFDPIPMRAKLWGNSKNTLENSGQTLDFFFVKSLRGIWRPGGAKS